MFIDEKHSSSLAKFLNQFNITILDTCSIMEEGFLKFADNLSNAKDYLKKENEIIVFRKCVKELKKHSKDNKNDYKRVDALRGLKVLKQLKRTNAVSFKFARGNKNFADNVIYTYVSNHRISKTILVITQDKNLCQDLKNLNKSLSQGGRPILVDIIADDGSLKENFGRPDGYVSKITNFKDRKERKPLRYPLPENKKGTPTGKLDLSNNKVLTPIEEIIKADLKLHSNLNNSTVKRFEKIEGIHDQLDRLSKIKESELKGVHLFYDERKLKAQLSSLEELPKTLTQAEPVKKPEVIQPKTKKVEPSKKVETPKAEVKKTEPKKEASKKKETKVKEEPKKVEKKTKASPKKEAKKASEKEEVKAATKKTSKKKKATLEEAKVFELKLNANMFNPTYPKDNKIKDLETFLEMVNSLSKEDSAQLKMNSSFIKNKIDELKK